ncbi:MAG TPA: DUF819 family protein [Vicinamibacteria bacterium]|nr:DUF819 family protein [Vicinamibacteria bacterium]
MSGGTALVAEPLAVLVVIALVVVVSLKLEAHVSFFRSMGAALVALVLGMVLSNAGVVPGESSVYGFLQGTGVSLGIVLILTAVDVRSIVDAGPKMLAAFGLGAFGSAVGAMVAGFFLRGPIGDETWKLAGQFTGTYVGGGVNFAALAQAFDTSSDLFTAAIAADVILTAFWMAACLAVPVILGRRKPQGLRFDSGDDDAGPEGPMTLERSLYSSGVPVGVADAASLIVVALGALLGARLLASQIPVVPEVLWLTTLALASAQIPAVKRLAGAAMIGNYLVLLFLASNGAQSVVQNIVRVGPAVFYFACITVGVHGIILFGSGRLLKLDPGTLAVASQANIGGAASAMAMASARGYTDRLLPGVAVGLLGYALGNYLGVFVAAVMRSAL